MVKLCDFGVSGELVDSIAGTFTGTSYYMAVSLHGKFNQHPTTYPLFLPTHQMASLLVLSVLSLSSPANFKVIQPERIQNLPYTIKADVWSLGLTLHEVAHLRFPFPPEGESQHVAPIELLSYIVTAPVPVMIDDPEVGRTWSEGIKDFMAMW